MASSVPGKPLRRDVLRSVADQRRRGIRGGVIPAHRSMVRLRQTPGRILQTFLLPVLGFVGVLAALEPLTRLWRVMFTFVLPRVGLPAEITARPIELLFLRFEIPYPAVQAAWPDTQAFIVVAGVAVLLVLLSLTLPSRFLPLSYFFRALALILGVSMAWFALADPPFAYPLSRYLGGLLGSGLVVLALVPLVLGFTFHLLDHPWWRKVLLTVLSLAHLAILLPLQILVHAWLIHEFSLLVQPTLFLVFGLLVEIMAFVAFYAWGMSWPGVDDADESQRVRP